MKTTKPGISSKLVQILISSLILIGCRQSADTASPNATAQDEGTDNLCVQYNSCDECVAGQEDKGRTHGTAESECALAVAGCWVTWEKPVTCDGNTMDAPDDANSTGPVAPEGV